MTDEEKGLEGAPDENAPAAEVEPSPEDETQTTAQRTDLSEEREGQAVGGKSAVEKAVQRHDLVATPISLDKSASAAAEPEEKPEVEASPVEPAEKPQAKSGTEEGGSQVDYSRTFRSLSEGDVVDGVVVHIDKEGVLVDVGTKSEGIIRPGELSSGPVQAAEEVVSVGDKIEVYVLQPENRDGNLILSKKRADFEKAWERVQQAYEDGKVLTAMVSDRVKGGLVVDLGIRGFVPGSHVGSGKVKNLDRYVGQSLTLKVIEVDRERRKVVLSHRLALDEERSKQREQTIASLIEGQIREGVVRRTTDYGAFVDLGGVDGLLHISEMSWTRINHPSEVVKVGQKIHVVVLRLNPEAGRVSLGLRQILPDPWSGIERKYKVGEKVAATVSRLVPFGAFVQLDGGIEGIVPNTELSQRRVNRPEDVVSVGESVEAKIIDIRPEERRMTLSVRQVHDDSERKDYESYQASRSDGRMTLGDLVGEKLQELVASRRSAEAEEEVAETAEAAAEPQAEEAGEAPEAETTEMPEAAEEAAEPQAEEAGEAVEAETTEVPEAAEEAPEEPVVSAESEAADVEPADTEAKDASEAEPEEDKS